MQTTRKAWFIRKVDDRFVAVAKNLDTGIETVVAPEGKPLPTIEATRRYINERWYKGKDFPGSIYRSEELGEPDEIVVTHCLHDIC